jgi:hypothetical protein
MSTSGLSRAVRTVFWIGFNRIKKLHEDNFKKELHKNHKIKAFNV